MYKLTRDVLVQTIGFSRSAGKEIAKGEIRNENLWDTWVREGVVIKVTNQPTPIPKPDKEEEAPLPKESGASPGKIKSESDKQLQDMSMAELKEMAKRFKLKGVHFFKDKQALIDKLEALS